jgi:hypothetical protein
MFTFFNMIYITHIWPLDVELMIFPIHFNIKLKKASIVFIHKQLNKIQWDVL